MGNDQHIDEERKRRAFINALSNFGLFLMSEEEDKEETAHGKTSPTGAV